MSLHRVVAGGLGLGLAGSCLKYHMEKRNNIKAENKEVLPWYKDSKNDKRTKNLSYDWLLQIPKEKDNVPNCSQNKVLILSYPRSGSTFLASVLSSSSSTAYYMEPLFALMPLGQLDWDYFLEESITRDAEARLAVNNLMKGIYDCNTEVTGRLVEWSNVEHTSVTAEGSDECLRSKNILVKTVR